MAAGPPVDLSRYQGQELTSQVLREATEDIMDAITAVLAEIRGEQPPTERFDLRKDARDRRATRAGEARAEQARAESTTESRTDNESGAER